MTDFRPIAKPRVFPVRSFSSTLLQVMAGALVVACLLGAGMALVPQPALPTGWQVMKRPLDAMVIAVHGHQLWIGGRYGLTVFDEGDSPLQTAVRIPPLRSVRALVFDRSDKLWVAHAEGVSCYDGQSWRHNLLGPERVGQPALSLCLSRDGALWVGTEDGVVRCRGPERTVYSSPEVLATPQVDAICEDAAGTLWFSSGSPIAGGLTRFDGRAWTQVDSRSGLPSLSITAMHLTDSGDLWLAAGAGKLGVASRLTDGQWTHITSEQGLAPGKARCIYVDRRGWLWVGHEREGLTILSGNRARVLTPRHGLPDWEVKQVVEDAAGNVWIATGRGLLRMMPHAVDHLFAENMQ